MQKRIPFLFFFLALMQLAHAQIEQPVRWNFRATPSGENEVVLTFTAQIDRGWHIYSQFIEEGGPVPTSFTFAPSTAYSLLDNVKEESPLIKAFDKAFGVNIAWFEGKALFTQRIALAIPQASITGTLEFMVCNDEKCLPPQEVDFTIPVNLALREAGKASPHGNETQITPSKSEGLSVSSESDPSSGKVTQRKKARSGEDWQSVWTIFLAGFAGGFAAFLMPCIFPMLPFTVSYFTKSSGRGSSSGRALLYGLSICIIYVSLGLLITVLFGANALNDLATNGIFNFFFFLLLIVFAASLLGAFDISLPSGWVNKVDAKADRGGVIGIFFMAATLSLVSFSCTGPIIGTLLVEAASMGKLFGPATGMLGFALALSLPFTLFSFFPSWMQALPKSGEWLNSVKVVLGFLELALALKFLSNVDLAYHWEWFDREVFLTLWIIIFGLMGLYLLGKIRLPHENERVHLSFVRLFFAIITLAFTLYMIPGLWGAPLKAVAAFLPPQQTQDFDLYSKSLSVVASHPEQAASRKYSDIFHAPYGLNAFFDYEEGIAFARTVNKPVLIDFTGHACVNCRKMEVTVWADERVLKRLHEEYVLIQLYVDDKTTLPEFEQSVSAFSGKKIKTLGNKWSDFQALHFNTNSQPYYVLLNGEEEVLSTPQGADYDVENFVRFLDSGLAEFTMKRN